MFGPHASSSIPPRSSLTNTPIHWCTDTSTTTSFQFAENTLLSQILANWLSFLNLSVHHASESPLANTPDANVPLTGSKITLGSSVFFLVDLGILFTAQCLSHDVSPTFRSCIQANGNSRAMFDKYIKIIRTRYVSQILVRTPENPPHCMWTLSTTAQ